MRKRLFIALAASLLTLALVAPAASAGSASSGQKVWTKQELLQYRASHGYLPIANPDVYEKQVAAAAARAEGLHPGTYAASQATKDPTVGPSWEGLKQDNLAPPDPTTAAGTKSYVQAINLQLGIYNHGGGLISSTDFGTLTGTSDSLSDPQVLWDTQTKRYIYMILDIDTATMRWGFSKTSNPTSLPGDFCSYNADFGWPTSSIPDYPKLGQTTDFLLVGVNVYDVPNIITFRGADVGWITKPGKGRITTCPDPSTYQLGKVQNLMDCDGTTLSANPNPGVQIDPSADGWIVANADPTNNGAPADHVDIYHVTKNPDGTANIPTVGTCVAVTPYSAPPAPAPQQGAPFVLDTLDGRFGHAVSAYDPLRGGTALWTSNTVFDGPGAAVHWYEIDVANAALFQEGSAVNQTEYVFNGAISPDRVWRSKRPSKQAFGSNMVLGFSTSSPAEYPAAQMVSKIGDDPQSAFVLVQTSAGPDGGFDCSQNPVVPGKCRWGDYAGAVPDPSANPRGATGRVFLSNMLATGDITPLAAAWTTWNWVATP